jgi:hypothetical protein
MCKWGGRCWCHLLRSKKKHTIMMINFKIVSSVWFSQLINIETVMFWFVQMPVIKNKIITLFFYYQYSKMYSHNFLVVCWTIHSWLKLQEQQYPDLADMKTPSRLERRHSHNSPCRVVHNTCMASSTMSLNTLLYTLGIKQ